MLLAACMIRGTEERAFSAPLPPGVAIRVVVQPSKAPPGSIVDLSITIEVPEGWVTFDLDQVANSVMPTRITLDKSSDFAPFAGYSGPRALETRDPMFNNRIVRFFPQSPTFHRQILVTAGTQAGDRDISGRIDLQLHDPATGKHYLIRQHPFQTTLTIQRESSDDTLGANETHKPIVGNEEKDAEPELPLPAREESSSNPATATSTEDTSLKPPQNVTNPSIEEQQATIAPSPAEAPSKNGVAVIPEFYPLPEAPLPPPAPPVVSPTKPRAKEVSTVAREPIVFEIGPTDLRIPFGDSLGNGDSPAFDWHAFENRGESPTIGIVILGFLIGGFAGSVRRDYEDWRRGLAQDAVGLAIGGLVGVPSLFLSPFLSDACLGVLATGVAVFTFGVSIRLRRVPFAHPADKPAGSVTWPILLGGIAVVVGTLLDNRWGPLFVMLGFAVGFVAGSFARVTRMSTTHGYMDLLREIGPPGLDQVFAMILVAWAMLLFGRADRLDGVSDWVGYRFVLASWTSMAFIATIQFLLPWPEGTGRLSRSPLRLTLAIGSLSLTLLFASHLVAPPVTSLSESAPHAPISESPSQQADPKEITRQANAVPSSPRSIQ
ncbi:MAG: hypothetical protein U1D30_17090 [Planctomycetota bacterium]